MVDQNTVIKPPAYIYLSVQVALLSSVNGVAYFYLSRNLHQPRTVSHNVTKNEKIA